MTCLLQLARQRQIKSSVSSATKSEKSKPYASWMAVLRSHFARKRQQQIERGGVCLATRRRSWHVAARVRSIHGMTFGIMLVRKN